MTQVSKTSLSFGQKFARGLALFLPGIFLLGFNIGTGSITTMAKAGADYGMTLLWTIVASCLCTFFMINLYSRYTLVTGVDGGIAPIWFAAFFSALVFFIFWNGKTQFFERSLAVIVAVMAACFLLNFFLMMPPPRARSTLRA